MTVEDHYDSFQFSNRSRAIMQNWEDIHECEDERDDKRLQKKAALTTESLVMTKAMNQNENYEDDEIGFSSTTHKFA